MGEKRYSGTVLREFARRIDGAVEYVDACGEALPGEVDIGPLGPWVADAVNEVAAHTVPLLMMFEATAEDLRRAAARYDEAERFNADWMRMLEELCSKIDHPTGSICHEWQFDEGQLDEVFNPSPERER